VNLAKPLRGFLKTISESWSLLNSKDRKKILFVSFAQTFSGFLDLLGIALFGLLGALAIKGIQSQNPNRAVEVILTTLNLDSLSLQVQAAVVGSLAGLILVSKTILSVILTKKTFRFLSRKCSELASDAIARLFSLPLLTLQQKSSQSIVYSMTSGITNLTIGVLGSLVMVIADFSLLLILFLGMATFDPALAVSALTLFLLIAALLHLTLSKKARTLGISSFHLAVSCNQELLEGLNSFRELFVKNQRQFYVARISENRVNWGKVSSELNFLPYISKYVIESSVLLGSLAVGAIQFAIHDAPVAAASLSIFLAAGTRIAPAVLRIQQTMIQMKVYVASSTETINLLSELSSQQSLKMPSSGFSNIHDGFEASIVCKDLRFSYPGTPNPAIAGINLNLAKGQTLAIVGRSGSGKTTLVDVLLGLIAPTAGTAHVSGLPPEQSIRQWPGSIAYVPQHAYIVDGSIRDNVSLGYQPDEVSDEAIWAALEAAQLGKFVRSLKEGLNSKVGENGTNLSGGQKQRLGIARALLTNPRLLVLDEATSALDSETEVAISDSVLKLRGETTIVIIAHRLSTVQNVDQVMYLDNGVVKSSGSFSSVRAAVPDFEHQAQLMGL
jgi:ABC-type multidrug transport system fused ATPase/permease subunit